MVLPFLPRGSSGYSRLRTTFAVTIVLAYCLIGVLTVAAFLLSARSLTLVFAARFARTEALLEKNRILSRIDREVALARKLADDPVVKLWAVVEDDPRVRSLALEELESYRRSFSDRSFFIAPLASRHYYIHNSAPGDRLEMTTLDQSQAADQWYFDTLRTVDTFALNVDYDRLIKSTKVWINVIMRDSRGIKIGLCGTGIDITDFLASVTQRAEENAVTILVDRAGNIEAHPNAAYVLRNAESAQGAKKLTIYDLVKDPSQKRDIGQAISDLSMDRVDTVSMPLSVEGRPYLAAISAMASINWYNVVLVDTSRVLRANDFLPLAATIVASLLLVLLVVVILLNRAVLRPLSSLAAASRDIAAGRYGVQIPFTRADEIGQLTQAFNSMSATVRDTTEGLEARVQERTRDLTQANRALEESQGLIMESLLFARRVQAGILPGPDVLEKALPERLVLYQPRDVVSGDFYVVRPVGDRLVVAVIDCMGHGVPGAFMTMRVHAVLSHILDAVCSTDAARIIAELDHALRDAAADGEAPRDGAPRGGRLDNGLDIGVCVCSPGARSVQFAGAGLPLFHWDGRSVAEVKGDLRKVGYRTHAAGAWDNHVVEAAPGSIFYLVTDGILDQSGGDRGFGFGRQRFAQLIRDVASLPLRKQETALAEALRAYQGSRSQRDDITVLGFALPGGIGK